MSLPLCIYCMLFLKYLSLNHDLFLKALSSQTPILPSLYIILLSPLCVIYTFLYIVICLFLLFSISISQLVFTSWNFILKLLILVLTLPFNSANHYPCLIVAHSVTKSCSTLCNPMDYSPPGSSVHGISQARILEWVAMSSSRGSSWPRDATRTSYSGIQILYFWATGNH